jgi:hypothetical protein
MFSRSFWRLVSLVSAAGAGMFLVRSFKHQPIALPDKSAERVKTAARKTIRRAAAKLEKDDAGGNTRRAH